MQHAYDRNHEKNCNTSYSWSSAICASSGKVSLDSSKSCKNLLIAARTCEFSKCMAHRLPCSNWNTHFTVFLHNCVSQLVCSRNDKVCVPMNLEIFSAVCTQSTDAFLGVVTKQRTVSATFVSANVKNFNIILQYYSICTRVEEQSSLTVRHNDCRKISLIRVLNETVLFQGVTKHSPSKAQQTQWYHRNNEPAHLASTSWPSVVEAGFLWMSSKRIGRAGSSQTAPGRFLTPCRLEKAQ